MIRGDVQVNKFNGVRFKQLTFGVYIGTYHLLIKCFHLNFYEWFTNCMQNRVQFALNLSQDFFLLPCQRRYDNTLNGLDRAIPHNHISSCILSFNTLMFYAC